MTAHYYPFYILLGMVGIWVGRRFPLKIYGDISGALGMLVLFILFIITLLFSDFCVDLLFYRQLMFALLSIGGLAYYIHSKCTKRQPCVRSNPWITLFGIILCLGTTWLFIADYILPHTTHTGRIEHAQYSSSGKNGHYEILIEGQYYPITRDLLPSLYMGEQVRFEIGFGTNTILHIEPLKAP